MLNPENIINDFIPESEENTIIQRDRINNENTSLKDVLFYLHNSIDPDPRTFDEVMESAITFIGPTASTVGEFIGNFLRDAQRMSEDGMEINNFFIAELTIWGAVHTRGLRVDRRTDQEPDKYIHEHRDKAMLRDVSHETEAIFEGLRKWSNAKPDEPVSTINYYGGEDQTPQHVIAVNKYEKKHPDKEHASLFLDLYVPHMEDPDNQITIRESAYGGLNRVVRKMREFDAEMSGKTGILPFYPFKRAEKTGIPFPVWTDSNFAAFHKDGSSVNTDDWVVHTQLQALSLTALISGAELKNREASRLAAGDGHKNELLQEAQNWENLARQVQTAIETNLWDNEENYPLFGLDRDEKGNLRPIQMQTSIGTEMLNTAYFDPRFWQGRETERLHQLSGILEKATSLEDFLTEGGPSVVSNKHKDLLSILDYIPYHMFVQWEKNVKEGVIDGCRLQGLPLTALAFSYLLRRSGAIYKELRGEEYFPEFSYLDTEKLGKKIYNLILSPDHIEANAEKVVNGTNMPVARQNWTASAIKGEETYIANTKNLLIEYASPELQALDEKFASRIIKYIESLPSIQDAIAYEKAHPVVLDIREGKRAEIFTLIRHGRESLMIENSIMEGIITEDEVIQARLAREKEIEENNFSKSA
ncbi:MAG TPA: hypothetical protein VLG12_01275 [Candidatus Saccharimonadales bacterium]|nr:hypothetical protein [Candidatus Saccharimonadales bacterium]